MPPIVLVTGGAGSMGRLVVARLVGLGMSVRAFDLPSVNFTGLEGKPGVEIARGDLTRPEDLASAVKGIDAVVHLAAVLPPVADRNPALTEKVNVVGTRALVGAVFAGAPRARFVFSSSVSVYGDTTSARPGQRGITVDQPAAPDDVYARSKADSERLVRESPLDWVVLRISGVAVPAFQEPPAAWPFLADQRVEFVHRDDAVSAIVAAVDASTKPRVVYNVAGGQDWRMTGRDYAGDYLELVGVERGEAAYQSSPGHFDWYETSTSQAALRYQDTPYRTYLSQIRAELERLMGQ